MQEGIIAMRQAMLSETLLYSVSRTLCCYACTWRTGGHKQTRAHPHTRTQWSALQTAPQAWQKNCTVQFVTLAALQSTTIQRAVLGCLVFNLKNKTTTHPQANKKHVFNINMMARVSGILNSKQNLTERNGTCRTDFLGFSDTSCVI